MIIGFDGSRAFQKDRTGTENYSYQLLKALAKIDNKNKYIVYLRPDYSSIPHRPVQERSFLNGWPTNFQFKEISWLRLWTQGGLGLRTFRDKLDVLFVPAHTLPIIRRGGLKTVVTVHDLGSEYLPSLHQLKQRLYLSYMQKFQLKSATKIIAVSKATKEDLVKRVRIEPEKVTVIYEGYNREKFKVQSSKFKVDQTLKKYNLIYRKYFLFVGTVQPRKNLERLIKAFAAFHLAGEKMQLHLRGGLKLVIAGSKGWLADEIYKLPKQLGIEERVKFLGYVADKNLPALYSGAIALTFPSLFEGFGLPILEAQACGCPVLTSNVSSMPEVAGYVRVNRTVAGSGAVYVDPYSTDDIVKGIKEINNQETRNKLVKAGLGNIKRFSWEKCARETLKVLESL